MLLIAIDDLREISFSMPLSSLSGRCYVNTLNITDVVELHAKHLQSWCLKRLSQPERPIGRPGFQIQSTSSQDDRHFTFKRQPISFLFHLFNVIFFIVFDHSLNLLNSIQKYRNEHFLTTFTERSRDHIFKTLPVRSCCCFTWSLILAQSWLWHLSNLDGLNTIIGLLWIVRTCIRQVNRKDFSKIYVVNMNKCC
jgi:hypothetical protein